MESRADLIDAIRAARRDLLEAMDGLGDEDCARAPDDGESVLQILAAAEVADRHWASQAIALTMLPTHTVREPGAIPARDRAWTAVKSLAAQSHDDVIATIEGLDDAQFEQARAAFARIAPDDRARIDQVRATRSALGV